MPKKRTRSSSVHRKRNSSNTLNKRRISSTSRRPKAIPVVKRASFSNNNNSSSFRSNVICPILFEYPFSMGPSEKNSKLLQKGSVAYNFFNKLRTNIQNKTNDFSPPRMDFHVDVSSSSRTMPIGEKLRIAQGISKKSVNLSNPTYYTMMGKAFVYTFPFEGKQYHITVFFSNNSPQTLSFFLSCLQGV